MQISKAMKLHSFANVRPDIPILKSIYWTGLAFHQQLFQIHQFVPGRMFRHVNVQRN